MDSKKRTIHNVSMLDAYLEHCTTCFGGVRFSYFNELIAFPGLIVYFL